jgi:CubicO group peptidase (beta-lactamase class C family)
MFAWSAFACDSDPETSVELRSQGQDNGEKNGHIYPGAQWQVGVPEDHGLSSAGLADMAAIAAQHQSTCLLVVRGGVLVGEWYWDGYDASTPLPDVWSVTKSTTAAVVGIAQAEGLLDIHDRASDYIPQWQGTASEDVTIFDLLTHTAGREWDFFSDIAILETADQTGYSLSFGQELEPGTRWDYSNLGTQALEAVLESAVGGDVEDYFQTKLFEPIGMNASLARDQVGNPLVYAGLSATCQDLARFGYLHLRKGRWNDEQVIPKAWVGESTRPSTELNEAYGYLWWLNSPGHVVLPSVPSRDEYDGKVLASASDDLYMALGAFGQFVAVDREAEIVVVRTTLNWDMSDPMAIDDMDEILGALELAKLE